MDDQEMIDGQSIGPLDIHRSLIEVASWRIAAELMRHVGGERFALVETHPGGHHDGLVLQSRRAGDDVARIAINRRGDAHASFRDGRHETQPVWDKVLAGGDTREAVRDILRLAEIDAPSALPTTPPLLVFRAIAGLLALGSLAPFRFECRNGMNDIPGLGAGVRKQYFSRFPEALSRLEVHEETDIVGEPGFRFWFLVNRAEEVGPGYEAVDDFGNGVPLLCFETSNGRMWDESGRRLDLESTFGKRRRMSDVFVAIIPSLAEQIT